ncbi:MAG: glycosyltransferase family 2 protein [Oscillospiraceae bacterium]|nr:glycosyltransferase family 2 protein [Oscillospiraceae bacterium]
MSQKIKRVKELFALGFLRIKEEGLGATLKQTASFAKRRFGSKAGRFLPKKQVLQAQRNQIYTDAWPLISICIPLYNTPLRYLEELLDSIFNQTYSKFEVCFADASDNAHNNVKQMIMRRNDDRIRYVSIENKDISTNTNAAVTLATGEYLTLADHDDVLSPNAFYELAKAAAEQKADFIYSDEALFAGNIKRPIVGHFKPDYAPEYLLGCNYICHMAAFKKELFEQVGGFDPACNGSQDHDLFLRMLENTNRIYHIPKVLYYWRVHEGSTSSGTAAKPYVEQAAMRAIENHLQRTGVKGTVQKGMFPSTYKVNYAIEQEPLVSILIPTYEHIEDLDKALTSIYEKTDYKNFEVLVIENNSKTQETFDYYKKIETQHSNLRVVYYTGSFNFSAINNFGRKQAKGEYLLLLNNDIEVINGAWLTEMVQLGIQPGVGIVGAMLYYPDDTIQHAGVIVGLGGFAGHSHKYAKRGHSGYMFRLSTVQNLSAVTAACMLVKASVYDEVEGLDEAFTVAFNDVDFCLRVRNKGYRILFTPYAQLYHYESKSRGLDKKGEAKERFDGERKRLKDRYGDTLTKDPFYNPNLTLDMENFSESAVLPQA